MSLYWNPWVLPFYLLAAGQIALGFVVYRARPDRFQNRLLGVSFVVWGIAWAVAGMRFSMADPGDFQAGYVTAQVGWLVYWGFYFAFLGTLDSPLSRPWSTRAGRWSLAVGVVAGSAFFLSPAGEMTAGVWPGSIGRFAIATTPLGTAWWVLTGVFAVYTLLVGISYLRRTLPGTAARSEAKAFVAAFAARDVPYAFGIFATYLALDANLGRVMWISSMLGEVALALVLTYGILKHQLLDIELKVKRTVKQGTVVAALAAVYVVTSFSAKAIMSPEAAQNAGIVLTGLLLFALVPLQRFGGRVADAAMPGVREDEAYLDQRKLEVYRAALEDAVGGSGDIAPADEDRLVRLRASLGLTDRDHALLLHGVRQPGGFALVPTFEPGRTVLGRYRIEEVLGEGGQGTTYKALDTTLGREVVLKALHGPDPNRRLKEARALAAVQHSNVVTIHDVERVGDHIYLVMEHVDGGSLKERLTAGPMYGRAIQQFADDLLAGLQAVHEAGLVHRDVKPSNVLLGLDGRAKLADLGIATTTDPVGQTTLGAGGTGARGTIAYMSPEQARGDKLTPASDLFSAAATLYEAYTGRPLVEPRPGESAVELQARAAGWGGLQEDLHDPELEAWFAKALAPDPADRFPHASGMREAFPELPAQGQDTEVGS